MPCVMHAACQTSDATAWLTTASCLQVAVNERLEGRWAIPAVSMHLLTLLNHASLYICKGRADLLVRKPAGCAALAWTHFRLMLSAARRVTRQYCSLERALSKQ